MYRLWSDLGRIKTLKLFFKKCMIFLISNGLYTLEPRVRVWFFHLLALAQGLRATRRDGGHRSLQFVRNLIVGHKMKLSEGNWQKEIDTTINLIPEAKPHLSRYLSSERLKFQRDKFVTKAWWSFKPVLKLESIFLVCEQLIISYITFSMKLCTTLLFIFLSLLFQINGQNVVKQRCRWG